MRELKEGSWYMISMAILVVFGFWFLSHHLGHEADTPFWEIDAHGVTGRSE